MRRIVYWWFAEDDGPGLIREYASSTYSLRVRVLDGGGIRRFGHCWEEAI